VPLTPPIIATIMNLPKGDVELNGDCWGGG